MTIPDTLITIIGWACFISLAMDTPLYDKVIRFLSMTHKPFTCPKCMAFWTSLPFYAIAEEPLTAVLLASITAAVASIIDVKINKIYG